MARVPTFPPNHQNNCCHSPPPGEFRTSTLLAAPRLPPVISKTVFGAVRPFCPRLILFTAAAAAEGAAAQPASPAGTSWARTPPEAAQPTTRLARTIVAAADSAASLSPAAAVVLIPAVAPSPALPGAVRQQVGDDPPAVGAAADRQPEVSRAPTTTPRRDTRSHPPAALVKEPWTASITTTHPTWIGWEWTAALSAVQVVEWIAWIEWTVAARWIGPG
jgi:hypothetical protein